jgi:hypothetical protein
MVYSLVSSLPLSLSLYFPDVVALLRFEVKDYLLTDQSSGGGNHGNPEITITFATWFSFLSF